MITFLKVLFLFLGVWFTCINTGKILTKSDVPSTNFLCQSIGITGFICLQWLM